MDRLLLLPDLINLHEESNRGGRNGRVVDQAARPLCARSVTPRIAYRPRGHRAKACACPPEGHHPIPQIYTNTTGPTNVQFQINTSNDRLQDGDPSEYSAGMDTLLRSDPVLDICLDRRSTGERAHTITVANLPTMRDTAISSRIRFAQQIFTPTVGDARSREGSRNHAGQEVTGVAPAVMTGCIGRTVGSFSVVPNG